MALAPGAKGFCHVDCKYVDDKVGWQCDKDKIACYDQNQYINVALYNSGSDATKIINIPLQDGVRIDRTKSPIEFTKNGSATKDLNDGSISGGLLPSQYAITVSPDRKLNIFLKTGGTFNTSKPLNVNVGTMRTQLADLKKITDEKAAKETELAAKIAEIATLNATILSLTSGGTADKVAAATATASLAAAQAQVTALQADVARLQGLHDRCREDLRDMTGQASEWFGRYQERERYITRLEQQAGAAAQEDRIHQMELAYYRLEDQRDGLQEEYEYLHTDYLELNRHLQTVSAERAQLDRSVQTLSGQIQGYGQHIQKLTLASQINSSLGQSEIRLLTGQKQRAEEELARVNALIARHDADIRTKNLQLETLRGQVAGAEEGTRAAEARIREQVAEIERIRAESAAAAERAAAAVAAARADAASATVAAEAARGDAEAARETATRDAAAAAASSSANAAQARAASAAADASAAAATSAAAAAREATAAAEAALAAAEGRIVEAEAATRLATAATEAASRASAAQAASAAAAHAEVSTRAEAAATRAAEAEATVTRLTSALEELHRTTDPLPARIADLEDQLATATRERDECRATLADVQARLAQAASAKSEADKAIHMLTAALESSRSEVDGITAQRVEDIQKLRGKLKALEDEKNRYAQNAVAAEGKHHDAEFLNRKMHRETLEAAREAAAAIDKAEGEARDAARQKVYAEEQLAEAQSTVRRAAGIANRAGERARAAEVALTAAETQASEDRLRATAATDALARLEAESAAAIGESKARAEKAVRVAQEAKESADHFVRTSNAAVDEQRQSKERADADADAAAARASAAEARAAAADAAKASAINRAATAVTAQERLTQETADANLARDAALQKAATAAAAAAEAAEAAAAATARANAANATTTQARNAVADAQRLQSEAAAKLLLAEQETGKLKGVVGNIPSLLQAADDAAGKKIASAIRQANDRVRNANAARNAARGNADAAQAAASAAADELHTIRAAAQTLTDNLARATKAIAEAAAETERVHAEKAELLGKASANINSKQVELRESKSALDKLQAEYNSETERLNSLLTACINDKSELTRAVAACNEELGKNQLAINDAEVQAALATASAAAAEARAAAAEARAADAEARIAAAEARAAAAEAEKTSTAEGRAANTRAAAAAADAAKAAIEEAKTAAAASAQAGFESQLASATAAHAGVLREKDEELAQLRAENARLADLEGRVMALSAEVTREQQIRVAAKRADTERLTIKDGLILFILRDIAEKLSIDFDTLPINLSRLDGSDISAAMTMFNKAINDIKGTTRIADAEARAAASAEALQQAQFGYRRSWFSVLDLLTTSLGNKSLMPQALNDFNDFNTALQRIALEIQTKIAKCAAAEAAGGAGGASAASAKAPSDSCEAVLIDPMMKNLFKIVNAMHIRFIYAGKDIFGAGGTQLPVVPALGGKFMNFRNPSVILNIITPYLLEIIGAADIVDHSTGSWRVHASGAAGSRAPITDIPPIIDLSPARKGGSNHTIRKKLRRAKSRKL
jgi:chromosome segregation ATPase